jgi:hypothetical protein
MTATARAVARRPDPCRRAMIVTTSHHMTGRRGRDRAMNEKLT